MHRAHHRPVSVDLLAERDARSRRVLPHLAGEFTKELDHAALRFVAASDAVAGREDADTFVRSAERVTRPVRRTQEDVVLLLDQTFDPSVAPQHREVAVREGAQLGAWKEPAHVTHRHAIAHAERTQQRGDRAAARHLAVCFIVATLKELKAIPRRITRHALTISP